MSFYPVDPNPGEQSLPTLKRWLAKRLGTPGVANPNPGEGILATLKRILASYM